jgi:hypothetical protein
MGHGVFLGCTAGAIRAAIEKICARFPDEYWLARDREGAKM